MSAMAYVGAVSGPLVFAIDAMPGVLPWLRLYCATVKEFKTVIQILYISDLDACRTLIFR
jgi:hypothetical protein